ncbi:MAG: histidine kinase [Intrasporangium sp.]|uniref:sensor histidine kinase n=1 Tax=Intrasporangium sp. TaxID=1925024 RepID=UPI00264A241D|nr:histidine kinase [Intrasporangium sp.]MDN5794436.1 histidine kinase [Intrasporangium sp.]
MANQPPTSAAGRWRGMRRSATLLALALWDAVLALWTALWVTLAVTGLGLWPLLGSLRVVRTESLRQRRLAVEYSGVHTHRTDVPWPDRQTGVRGVLNMVRTVLSDRRAWADLLWVVVNPLVGGAIAAAPLVLALHGVFGILLLWLWQPVVQHWDNSWYTVIPLTGLPSAVMAAGLGVVEVVLAFVLAGRFVDLHARWVRAVLGRVSVTQLHDRVVALTDSRADVVEMQAAELRRIERDLHDGAQARLVAMGMNIGAAEQLIGSDPEAARRMLRAARASSADALAELRDLVRGVHPPVLADRGLAEAMRALALEAPATVEVIAHMSGRAPLPIEAAMYFAGSELLSNAMKHSGANHIEVMVTDADGLLSLTVKDNGRGGVAPSHGSGLRGVERRLAVFDGSLSIQQTPGGPTVVTASAPLAPLS